MSELISIVVPVYACIDCLQALASRITQVLGSQPYELLLVDDRSPDGAWGAIEKLAQQNKSIRGIRLSRNFGQHMAITAGIAQARGNRVVVMDCDLQDPPEMIPMLLAKLDEGYDMVLTRRSKQGHSLLRCLCSRLYFRLFNALTGQRVDSNQGSFSALSRKVADAFLTFTEKDRHYLFVLRWLGFSAAEMSYEQPARHAGRSSYSLRRLLRHAIDGLFFQSTILLRWIVGLGLLFALAGMGLAAYYIYHYFAYGSQPGWTSLMVALLLSTGCILIALGVIGQYIAKIFEAAKGRPLYVIDVTTDAA